MKDHVHCQFCERAFTPEAVIRVGVMVNFPRRGSIDSRPICQDCLLAVYAVATEGLEARKAELHKVAEAAAKR